MKIKKIAQIQNLGLYNNFNWDDNCPEFKQFNFFYGWNYSGKTSLSRLFRCLEMKKIHPDYPNLKFELESENGDISDENIESNGYPIRVYNEDFVEENFKWNDNEHKINPVLIVGKESIELQEKLKQKKVEKQNIDENKKKIENELKNKSNQLDKSLTDKASEIRNILSITNPRDFDKNTLKSQIEKIKTDTSKYIFSDDEKGKNLRLYGDQTDYQTIGSYSLELKTKSIYQKLKNLCERKITAQQIIEKLKNNPELNQWVRKGLDLHKNETACQFCGSKLPDDLFDKLNKHFSEEYDKLMQELSLVEKEINIHKDYINKINFNFTDKARLYSDFAKQYEQKKEELKDKLQNDYINTLNTLIKKIEEKRNKPFDSLNFVLDTTELEEQINQYIYGVNTIINDNNTKINQLNDEKKQIKEKLINHFVATAIDQIKYFEQKNEIEIREKQKKEKEKEFNDILKTINDLNSQIKQANIGAEKINEYLQKFFGDDQIKLNPLEDGTYQVQRAGNIAKNLSTGERNIIALVYFITKLEENDFDKSHAIIFIDDPVSSLDSNHIFQVYGFLSEKLKDCGQVFITTHNFDFYNLLKDMVKSDPVGTPNRRSKEKKENYYLIKKIQSNGDKISTIIELPKVLRNFKSEYNYLFSKLKEYHDSNEKNNFELLYILPNIARRFLESYLFAKYPDGSKFKNKANKFFKDFVDASKKQTTLKILDEYSHEENPEHTQKFPDINEVETAVETILSILEEKDQEHYEALCKSIEN